MFYDNVISELLNGNAAFIFTDTFKITLANDVTRLINIPSYDEIDIKMAGDILHIGNIIAENMDLDDDMQPLDNGVYDILLERYRYYNPNVQIGAEPVHFENVKKSMMDGSLNKPVIKRAEIERDSSLFMDDIMNDGHMPITRSIIKHINKTGKKYRVVAHGNNDLVGTLRKVKFVTDKQAIDAGVYNDPSVKILERDFFATHMQMGLISPSDKLKIVAELKYDGLSVVVTIRNKMVISAVSRGDTASDKATDLTPILYGYVFPNLPDDIELDLKCEAVMTYLDLYKYNKAKGYDYKNCRSAIIGLFSSNDGYMYKEFITLVPLKIAPSSYPGATNKLFESGEYLDRTTEIEFMNNYLATKEPLRYSYIEGNFTEVLFLIKKFEDEADAIRCIMPTMYDGVVVSYDDPYLVNALGRKDFTNMYSIAVKFNPLKKQTTIVGVDFKVGQDGTITPMVYYRPVEFLGTIHTKSSVSSVARFQENKFKIGNIIDLEYRHDVMPYASTPDLDCNENNPNPVLEFIKECPVCGTSLVLSKTGKSAKCPNLYCEGRRVSRLANMMDKLGLRDFAESSFEKLTHTNLKDLVNISREELIDVFGEVNSSKFVERMKSIISEPIYDFQIIGSLGFSGIAVETWKKICNFFTIQEIVAMYDNGTLNSCLCSIKGIGESTATTIAEEMEFFYQDILFILSLSNVITSKGLKRTSVRFTGFRDAALIEYLQSIGVDATDGGVNKETDILLIPDDPNYTSSKMNKVGPNCRVVHISDFRDNMEYYLSPAK